MVLGYPGMIGIKGGLTTKAGHTYVGAATRNGHTIIETLMLGGTDVFDQAAKLMDWAFAADGKVAPLGSLGGGSGSGSKPSAAPSPTPSPSSPTGTPTPTPTPAPATMPVSPTPTPTPTLSLSHGGPTISIVQMEGPPSWSHDRGATAADRAHRHVSRSRGSSAMPWSDAAWIGAAAARRPSPYRWGCGQPSAQAAHAGVKAERRPAPKDRAPPEEPARPNQCATSTDPYFPAALNPITACPAV